MTTAKDFLTKGAEGYPMRDVIDNIEDEDILDAMIEFAKHHVEQALKLSHINMQLPEEDLVFTLNSYPLDNIK